MHSLPNLSAPIIFYVDGSSGTGSDMASKQKDETLRDRRAQSIETFLEQAGFCCGEVDALEEFTSPRLLVVVAIATLRSAFIENPREGGPVVHLVTCQGEADPYLSHDGKFATLIISNDSDFVTVPGVSVAPNDGILLGATAHFITRDMELFAEELSLTDFACTKIAELVSFVGNDYSRSILEQNFSGCNYSIQEMILAKADALSGKARCPFIDRLVALISNEKELSEVLQILSESHPDLLEAIRFTRDSMYSPDQLVRQAMAENPVDDSEFDDLSISVTLLRKGNLPHGILPEDFSVHVPAAAIVVLPITAALFAVTSPEDSMDIQPLVSYRVGIDYLEDKPVDVQKILGVDYPIGVVSKDETLEARFHRVVMPLVRSVQINLLTSGIHSLFQEDKKNFETFFPKLLIPYTVGLSASSKDPLTIYELLSIVSMLSVLSKLASMNEKKRQKFLATVTQFNDSQLNSRGVGRGLSNTEGGFRDVTIATRFIEVYVRMRTLSRLVGLLDKGKQNALNIFHGPLFSMFLVYYSAHVEEETNLEDANGLREIFSDSIDALISDIQGHDEFLAIRGSIEEMLNLIRCVNVCGLTASILYEDYRPKSMTHTASVTIDQLFDDSMLEVAHTLQEEEEGELELEGIVQVQDIGAELPVAKHRQTILNAVRDNPVIVIEADTGAGKSSQVPQYLLEETLARSGNPFIICTQPRRISAITLAQRVAQERGESSGATVSYAIGHDNRMNLVKGYVTVYGDDFFMLLVIDIAFVTVAVVISVIWLYLLHLLLLCVHKADV